MNSKKTEWLMVSVSLAWGSSYLLMKVGYIVSVPLI